MKRLLTLFIAISITASLAAQPRAEYPRPQFERSEWINLNGEWSYSLDNVNTGFERRLFDSKGFDDKIIVPFCPESKLSGVGLSVNDSHEVTKLLHIIGDMERISDHAVNIVESAEEMRDKHMTFSSEAQHELTVLRAAVGEIIRLAQQAFVSGNLTAATSVEPLEQTVDLLRDRIKLNHTLRLQKSECTIEHGFVLSDILTDLERVADHCSNIAGCVIEIAHNSLGMHSYTQSLKRGNEEYEELIKEYSKKYPIDSPAV